MNPTIAASITEKEWSGLVVSLAKFSGWAVYHTYNSQRSEAGFPDLTLVRPPELLMVELKTEKGKMTAAQERWLTALEQCGIETAVWRPSDWNEVEQALRAPRQR